MWIATATIVALSVCLAGCSGSSPDSSPDKAGEQVAPLVLTAVSPEAADRPSGAQLTAFVDAVDQLSEGRITVEPTFGVEDPRGVGPDQATIQAVQAGGVDLGLAAARAFSAEGVTSLRALTVPFLIETDAGAAAVARSDTITGPMLAGLADVGLTGLALLPETIRHPFGVRGPVLGPQDYAGAVIRSAPSEETYAVFEALGAKPQWWDAEEFVARMDDETIDIVESSFGIAGSVLGRPAIGTGNVAFFPRMNVLVANSEALTQLTGDQRNLLDRAAAQALDTAIANVPQDAQAAAQYCQDGGQVVLATQAQREALRELVAPYVASLQEDPTTRDAIAGINDTLASDPASAPVAACGTPVTDQALEP
jgi:TRAP-type C4-dicarboxylate transport system substrate-binding protein